MRLYNFIYHFRARYVPHLTQLDPICEQTYTIIINLSPGFMLYSIYVSHKPAGIKRYPEEHRWTQPWIKQAQMEAIRNGEHVHHPWHWDSSNQPSDIRKSVCTISDWFLGWVEKSHPNQLRSGDRCMGEYRQIGIQPEEAGGERGCCSARHLQLTLMVAIQRAIYELWNKCIIKIADCTFGFPLTRYTDVYPTKNINTRSFRSLNTRNMCNGLLWILEKLSKRKRTDSMTRPSFKFVLAPYNFHKIFSFFFNTKTL